MRRKKHKGVYPRVLKVLDFPDTGPGHIKVLHVDVLNEFLTRHKNCKCTLPEHGGLRAGMSLRQINRIRGCNDNWVCPCLDAIRRRLGH